VAGSNYEVNIKLDVRKINQQLSNLERRIKKLNEIAMGQRGAGKTVLKTERDKLAVATRTFRKEQQITREKQKQSRIENQTTRNINARNVARSAGKPKATTPVATGGGGGGIVSGALISGAFPLLFGQGLVGGAAGFGGGLLGGAIGGQTGGFAGGLVATALLTLITEAIEFRKEVEKVNDVIERTGGTSRITAGEITSLAKRMKVTKEEALQAANAFAAFGAQSSLALAETFKDRSTFNLYANLNKDAKTFITTVDTLFQKNELGIDQAKRSLKVLQTKGLEEASIYAEAIKNEQEIRKELEETKPSEADKRKADYLVTFAIP
jgi:predicted lipid-binding transport protein (Tim44 family)